MSTEHAPIFPRKEKWQCSCGMINDFITYTCISCGKTHVLSTYIDPCDECGLCKKLKDGQTDWLVRNDLVRY